MPSPDHLLAFAVAAFIIIVIPGPSVLFVVSRGIALGRRAALATVVGNAGGEYLQVVAVALGLGAVVERSGAVFTTIKLLGATYLVYLGVRTFIERRSLARLLDTTAKPKTSRRILREGLVVGLTNPKTTVFFAAVLPQFVDPSAGRIPLQMLLLGLIFLAIAVASDTVWALAAGSARHWLRRSSRRLELLGGAGGIATIAVGLRLALTSRRD